MQVEAVVEPKEDKSKEHMSVNFSFDLDKETVIEARKRMFLESVTFTQIGRALLKGIANDDIKIKELLESAKKEPVKLVNIGDDYVPANSVGIYDMLEKNTPLK